MNRDERVFFPVFSQHSPQKGLRRRSDIAEAEFAFLPGRGASDATQRVFPSFKQYRGFVQEHFASGSQTHVVFCPIEDSRPELRFQFLHRPAQGRLGYTKSPRRAGKVQFLGNCLKVSKMTQIHKAAGNNKSASP